MSKSALSASASASASVPAPPSSDSAHPAPRPPPAVVAGSSAQPGTELSLQDAMNQAIGQNSATPYVSPTGENLKSVKPNKKVAFKKKVEVSR
jgi:hypothetical protein